MPTPRAGAAVAVLGKQILVVGGVGEDQSPLKVVEMYNTEEGRWRKRSSLREALMGVSITVKGTDYITISRNKRCTAEKQNQPKVHTLCFNCSPSGNVVCVKLEKTVLLIRNDCTVTLSIKLFKRKSDLPKVKDRN